MQHGLGSLRGAIGNPEQVLDLCRRYEAVGVDQVIFVLQAGPNRHEHICESLELFARRVMPEFTLDREQREQAKAEQLAPAVERALARREPAREAPPGYVIDEQAELERAARARREGGLRSRLAELGEEARRSLQRGGQEALARLVRGASDAQLERRFGSELAQRAIFTGMARQFEPKFAFGFEGDIAYELAHHGNGKAALALDRAGARRRSRGRAGRRRARPGDHLQAERAGLRPPARRAGRPPGAALRGPLRRGRRPGAGHARAGDVRRAAAVLGSAA